MAPVKKEKFDSSSFWLGPTMECLSIRPQHWPFYAESSPAILKMPDPWWFTAGRPHLTLTQILQHAQKLLFRSCDIAGNHLPNCNQVYATLKPVTSPPLRDMHTLASCKVFTATLCDIDLTYIFALPVFCLHLLICIV